MNRLANVLSWAAVSTLACLTPILVSCGGAESPAPEQGDIKVETFGKLPSGEEVQIYTLTNKNGMEARIMNRGAILVSLKVPDREGNLSDVVLGFDNLEGYLQVNPYFGAVVGRYGNRIANGKFELDGQTYTLPVNNGPNSLHGGITGFDKVLWNAEPGPGQSLALRYLSADGEEGYPGELSVKVTYTLTDDNELKIDYEAATTKPTVLNVTNHSYFNLKDGGASPILEHEIMLNADRMTPVDDTLIPTGELKPVEGTPFDLRKPTPIGAGIDADDEQIKFGGGYDHNFVLNGEGMKLAAQVYEPTTGRVMEVSTTEPGVQFYTGNFLDGTLTGKAGTVQRRSGFCLETQHYPDSPNQPSFPSTVLRPGETHKSTTVFKFSTR